MTAPRRIEGYIARLRAIAQPVGPLHSYWEIIMDLEAVLRGEIRGPAQEEVIALAERALGEH